MESRPLISIIMAVKDTGPYLAECLDSIRMQTYENWELIAVNDHSSDDSWERLNDYAQLDNRIRIFQSKGHRLNPALKEGYQHCRGILINRMDSDDRMPPDKLEAMFDVWALYGKGVVVAGGVEHFVEKGTVGLGFQRYDQWLNQVAKTSTHYQQIYKECVIPSHCWLIHKEDFSAVGAFDPDVYPEDYDLCFRFYRKGYKIIGMDKILHFWRDREDRISRTWIEYKDNRYFELKLKYFFELDRDSSRPLVVWGAGRNGKDFIKVLAKYEQEIHWVCDNERKIGKEISGHQMQHFSSIKSLDRPQIIVVIAAPSAKSDIENHFTAWGKRPIADFWFFA